MIIIGVDFHPEFQQIADNPSSLVGDWETANWSMSVIDSMTMSAPAPE